MLLQNQLISTLKQGFPNRYTYYRHSFCCVRCIALHFCWLNVLYCISSAVFIYLWQYLSITDIFGCTLYISGCVYIVHPESFRSNAQNANAFARRNRPRVDRNDEFACVYLRLRACVCEYCSRSTVCAYVRAHVRMRARTYIGKVWAWHYLR